MIEIESSDRSTAAAGEAGSCVQFSLSNKRQLHSDLNILSTHKIFGRLMRGESTKCLNLVSPPTTPQFSEIDI